MLIKIELPGIFKEDERGTIYEFSTRPSSYFIVIYRKKGTVSGSHYHKGTIQSKNPEMFYLVSGEVELFVRDIKTGEEETHIIQEKTKIEVPPNIYHEWRAKTDIILLEFNTSREDFRGYESDTIRPQEIS